jgi:alpha-beta hydrolase superfamily lysophospholipase
MKKILLPSLFSLFFFSCGNEQPKKEVIIEKDTVVIEQPAEKDSFMVFGHLEFPASDGLVVTANSYEIIPSDQYILLCHQAGSSRGEYRETATMFNDLGYNVVAIDQRSGDKMNDMVNETAKRAKEQKLEMDYLSAEKDILAGIDYIYNKTGKKVILLGSSYSASLALKIAAQNDKVMAVLAFSPAENIKGIVLQQTIKGISIPAFITSSKDEAKDVQKLVSEVGSSKTVFVPNEKGEHGSSALWSSTPNNAEYWTAVKSFLSTLRSDI